MPHSSVSRHFRFALFLATVLWSCACSRSTLRQGAKDARGDSSTSGGDLANGDTSALFSSDGPEAWDSIVSIDGALASGLDVRRANQGDQGGGVVEGRADASIDAPPLAGPLDRPDRDARPLSRPSDVDAIRTFERSDRPPIPPEGPFSPAVDAAPGQFCQAPILIGGAECAVADCRGPGCDPQRSCSQPSLVTCPEDAKCSLQGGTKCRTVCENGSVCDSQLGPGGAAVCTAKGLCSVVCSEGDCKLTCNDNSQCQLSSAKGAVLDCGNSQCSVICYAEKGSPCKIDCRDGASCIVAARRGGQITCHEDSSCDVTCGAESCELSCDVNAFCRCRGPGCKPIVRLPP